MRFRIDNQLYVVGNKQFLADCLNGILNMETDFPSPIPHYLPDGTIFTNVLGANKLWEKVLIFILNCC